MTEAVLLLIGAISGAIAVHLIYQNKHATIQLQSDRAFDHAKTNLEEAGKLVENARQVLAASSFTDAEKTMRVLEAVGSITRGDMYRILARVEDGTFTLTQVAEPASSDKSDYL